MKTLVTKGYYQLSVIIFFLCAALPASAQYSGINFETGGLNTAITKDNNNNLYSVRVMPGTAGATYEVEKYTGGTGTPAIIYTSLLHETGDYPWGLAVDGSGNVFVTTAFNAGGSIIKLTYGGGTTYTASTYQSGRYFSALAFDAGNNLFSAEYDAVHKTYAIVKYVAGSPANSAGTLIYDNLKAGAGYGYPTGLVLAPNGDIYVANAFSNVPELTDGGLIYKLTAATSYSATTVSTGNYSASLTLDASGNLYSTENRGTGYNLYEYANGGGVGAPIFKGLHTNGIYYPWGIAFYSSAKIFVVDGDDGINGGAIKQLYLTPPTVTTSAATSLTTAGAKLNGLVNDNGNTTTVNFVYGTSPTLAGATTTPATTGGTINAGSGNTAVALSVTGLSPSTVYYYAVSATNSGGNIQGSILNFTTLPTISYSGPDNYLTGVAIAPLTPTHSTVPAPAYHSPVVYGSGFSNPFSVASDGAGNIYVADLGNKELKKIPAGGGTPVILKSGYTTLTGVAVDNAGNVYVCDEGTATVQKIPGGGTGTPVSIGSGFVTPYCLAVDAAGNVYVGDYGNNAIKEIPVGGGAPISLGSGFLTPTAVAVDGTGNIYVADYGNHLVKEIPVGGGAPVSIGTGFSAPVGVGVDAMGDVFVADYGNNNVFEIRAGGTTVSLGSAFTNPTGVAVDGYGKLYVANYLGSNVEQLIPAGGFYLNTALPKGLSFSGSTGVISGTPEAVSPATNYMITAYDAGGGTSATVNIKTTANANLANLTISAGTLTPVFATGTTSYTASVLYAASTITVTPTTADATAIVKVNGTAVTSGAASGPIALNVGSNTITTVVTAQDGTTTKTYTVTVTRAAASNNAYLATINLTPAASLTVVSGPDYKDYTASVPNTTSGVTVTFTTHDPTATVKVNGTTVASGTASGPIALSVGPNTITIVSTAQDGVTTKTYAITVTRAASNNAYLATINLTPAASLTVVSGPDYQDYTASVPNTTSSVTVTFTTHDPTATVKVNGTTVASGTPSGAIALSVGPNTITIVSTAQDGVTTKTYGITVTRAAASLASLSALQLSSGTLTPVFATGTTSYTASVLYAASTITVTPTTSVGTATIKVNGTTVASGAASGPIALNVGSNTITTVVTAQDGTTTKTYTVMVTRAAASNNAYLATINLTPAASLTVVSGPDYQDYTASVPNTTSSVTVTFTTHDPTATVKVNGTTVAAGTPSGAIALSVGPNTITIVSTAQDGVTTKTYGITVTRMASVNIPDATVSVSSPTNSPQLAEEVVVVHAGVSPNGDGINDYLQIDGILAYPDNKLTIMNRNGLLVYEAKGYDNGSRIFDGHSNKNGQMQLPGTYFFSLTYTANGVTMHKTGYIILKY